MSIKLAPELEQRLRLCSQRLGRSVDALVHEASASYLDAQSLADRSSYVLGVDLFGKHGGPKVLASGRRRALVDLWAAKPRLRTAPAKR